MLNNRNEQRAKQLIRQIQLSFVFLFALGGLVLFHSSVKALPGRVSSVTLSCAPNGALSITDHYWWDYPSGTTGQAYDEIFKYEGGGWVWKGSNYKSKVGSSGQVTPAKGDYGGAGASFQVRGRTWINSTGLVDLTRSRWCS